MKQRDKGYFQIEILGEVHEKEHFHQDLELIYILDGSLVLTADHSVTNLEREDLFLINANKKHFCQGIGNLLFIKFHIDYAMISDMLGKKNLIFWCDSTRDDNSRYEELRRVLRSILKHYLNLKNGLGNFEHILLCYHMASILTAYFMIHASSEGDGGEQIRVEDRVEVINRYVDDNYQRKITLKDLAEELYLSEGYLSRFFKKIYGMSFAAYLENIRIYHVVDDLLYTDEPITDIAYRNGFSNMTAFNKAFKSKHGMTPSAMRREIQQWEQKQKDSGEEQKLESRLEEYLRRDGLKIGEKVKIFLKYRSYQPSHQKRQNLCGII